MYVQGGRVVATKSCNEPGVHVYRLPESVLPGGPAGADGQTSCQPGSSDGGGDDMLIAADCGASCTASPEPAEGGFAWNPFCEGLLVGTCERGHLALYRADAAGSCLKSLGAVQVIGGNEGKGEKGKGGDWIGAGAGTHVARIRRALNGAFRCEWRLQI
eukprot:364692-Chlamydomonas_euryale.AAC.16